MLNKINFNAFRTVKTTQLVSLLLIGAVLISACQSASVLSAPAIISTNQPAVVASETPVVASEPTDMPTTVPTRIPSVTVSDQSIENGTLKITSVVSNGAGWLVIHTQVDGKPGPILGYTALAEGDNQEVVVDIDSSKATETLTPCCIRMQVSLAPLNSPMVQMHR